MKQQGESRWRRLRPADVADWVLGSLAAAGLLLAVLFRAFPDGVPTGDPASAVVLAALTLWHGSTPALTFVAAAFYLVRRGRCLGSHRAWVWGGLAVTAPLWLLVGLPVSVRGLGDVTWLALSLNLVAAGLMTVGVVRTLRA